MRSKGAHAGTSSMSAMPKFEMESIDQDFIRAEIAKTTPLTGPMDWPESLAELDIASTILEDLALKTLYVGGTVSVLELADKLKLSYNVATQLFSRLRADLCCQVTGMLGNIPQIAITSSGRTRAADLLMQSRYVGPAPVSHKSYVTEVKRQSVKKVAIHAEDIQRAFSDLVVDDETLRSLGTALNSGSSLFLYGPAGTGKSTYAEALSRALAENEVYIPHAVEVDGQIITLYDPSVHSLVEEKSGSSRDQRWVLCKRPAVLVGGELTAEMLDLQFGEVSRFYVAPVQMKANNGVLIIDDFGRQRLRPEELLNRWIVPLDRRIDFLTMSGGKKVEIPFEMLVVFASNFNPSDLVDPAFIRRIKTKIKVGACNADQFREIFRRVAVQMNVNYEDEIPDRLMDFIKFELKQELRSCYPRDIIEQVCWAARYENREPFVDLKSLKQAIVAYFV
jgi:predicted ATPase with chaperone activity